MKLFHFFFRTILDIVDLLKKANNIFLALILLVAVTGVRLNKHYCMGEFKTVTLFASSEPCADDGTSGLMPCCEDVSERLQIKEIVQASFDFDIRLQLAVVNMGLDDLFNVLIVSFKPLNNTYSIPFPDKDIPVYFQSLLI